MFDLTDSDVEQLHTRYLEDEDIEMTFDRLTAPFNCDLFDGLCDQVGEQQAIEITGELVDLGLDGATPDEVETYLDARLDAAMDGLEEQNLETTGFRGTTSSPWVYNQTGSARMKVRTGITTPLIGKRKAWTVAVSQVTSPGTNWYGWEADAICVNVGTNTQTRTLCGGGSPCATETYESQNPGNSCVVDERQHKVQTSHKRKTGKNYAGGVWSFYTLTSRGCATANIEGFNFSVCGLSHSRTY